MCFAFLWLGEGGTYEGKRNECEVNDRVLILRCEQRNFTPLNKLIRDPTAHASSAVPGLSAPLFLPGWKMDSEQHLLPCLALLIIRHQAHCEQLLGGKGEFWFQPWGRGTYILANSYTQEGQPLTSAHKC